jgi:hypothetical protein
MSSWTPTGYTTKNWVTFNRALNQRGSLLLWFDATLLDKQGLQKVYRNAAIQACFTIKVLFCVLLRQATGLVESLLKSIWLNWPVPDFSTFCRRQKTLSVAIPYQGEVFLHNQTVC